MFEYANYLSRPGSGTEEVNIPISIINLLRFLCTAMFIQTGINVTLDSSTKDEMQSIA